MQRIAIVGLGLIGGSIGLGLREWSAAQSKSGDQSGALEVVGFDIDLDQQGYAKKAGAVDKTEWELGKAVRGSDLVIVATPVLAIRNSFVDIAPHLKGGSAVTDVGSTKANVVAWADELLPRTTNFVGGHPMAGKALSIEGAEAGLFKGATWCVTPSVRASDESIRTVLGMIAALGAEPYFIDPTEHDAYVAGISHLPFVLSAALMNTVSTNTSWRDMRTLTAGGFRDMTRLAGGSPAMHRDIAVTNRLELTRWIDQFSDQLAQLRQELSRDEEDALPGVGSYFNAARDARADWATQTTREGELLQSTDADLSGEGFGNQMGRMMFGGFFRRRGVADRIAPPPAAKNGQGRGTS